ncbi:MAG: site-specific DNA-methyltransferase [Candidatus Omnitrophica bacterium]|nr:site-specific DNA-methyltransferase [Candidatus Omnitrophota bacterium]
MIDLRSGDCLEVVKTIPDNSVDLVLTDPPYGIGIADWDKKDYYDFLFKESMRVLKNGCYAFIFSTKKNLKRPEFKHDIYAVIKNFSQYRQHLGMIDAWYPIIYFVKGKPRKLQQKRNWILMNTANTSRNKDNPKTGSKHRTPKNMELMKHLVECHSSVGDTVIDPFMGEGSTGLACKQLNRNFIGIEISPEYFKISERRINQTMENLL